MIFRLFPAFLLTFGLLSCGGGSPPPPAEPDEPPPSGLTSRVFVLNDHPTTPAVNIVDAANDQPVLSQINMNARPQFMVLTPDRRFTIVYHAGSNLLLAVDNSVERVVSSNTLPDWTESIVVPNDNLLYAAVRGIGAVTRWQLDTGAVNSDIAIPTVRRLVKNPGGTRVLAFSDDSDALTVIDTATHGTTVVGGFDRPAWGVFNADGSKAYILSCGPQCGGTAAGVTELNMGDLTLGAHIAVSAASAGILSGSNLFVAGSTGGGGVLDVVDTAAMTLRTAGVAISDGFHRSMALSDSSLFIGAVACTSCLTVVNTTTHNAVVGPPKGEVTGLQPIANRNVIYVAEGGEMRIYDSGGTEQLPGINFIGRITDVKQIN